MNNELRAVLDNAISHHGISETARRLGYRNHTLLSRVLRGHIEPGAQFWSRVERAFARIQCPAQVTILTHSQCAENRGQPAPTHNPAAMQQWKTCQRCIHRRTTP